MQIASSVSFACVMSLPVVANRRNGFNVGLLGGHGDS